MRVVVKCLTRAHTFPDCTSACAEEYFQAGTKEP